MEPKLEFGTVYPALDQANLFDPKIEKKLEKITKKIEKTILTRRVMVRMHTQERNNWTGSCNDFGTLSK